MVHLKTHEQHFQVFKVLQLEEKLGEQEKHPSSRFRPSGLLLSAEFSMLPRVLSTLAQSVCYEISLEDLLILT